MMFKTVPTIYLSLDYSYVVESVTVQAERIRHRVRKRILVWWLQAPQVPQLETEM